jgi:Na+-transporting methylmalonyl-CoA/oxaloacetate decarboxylase beta subunit
VRAFATLLYNSGFAGLTWQNLVMFAVGGVLIYLAVRKGYEPLLLIPIGFGAILANLPYAMMSASMAYEHGTGIGHPLLQMVYDVGIRTEFLPPIIFLGVGALTDFRPLLGRPITFLLGAAAQFGIFVAALGAFYLFGFSIEESAAIGIIGGADGPTSRERAIDMPQAKPVSQTAVILFPIVTAVLAALAVPACAPLIGMLMFGNLLRESGVTDRLFKTAGGALINIVTIFLGITVGATMEGATFLRPQTIFILVLGAFAFGFSTFGGVLFAKVLNLALPARSKINPCIGAAGVSAVPMSARVVQDFVTRETDGKVNPLMAAMGPNVAGVIGSAVAAGVFLALLR